MISEIYFWNKTLHVSDISSVHHQEFFTVHTAMVYVIQVTVTACEQDQDGTAVSSWCYTQAVTVTCMSYTITICTVKIPDDGHRNSPKHVEFYFKNKFEKLVHLVGFIIRKLEQNCFRHFIIFPFLQFCYVKVSLIIHN